MKKSIIITFFMFSTILFADEIKLATLQVNTGDYLRKDTPLSASLDGININQDNGIVRLFEKTKDGRVEVPCQLELGYTNR